MADMSGVISHPSDWRLMLGGHNDADARHVYEPTRVCEEGQYFRLADRRTHKGLGKGDIGEFVTTNELVFNRNMPFLPASQCPGTVLLLNPHPPSFVSPHIVSALAHSCGGKSCAQAPAVDCNRAIISLTACKILRERVERAFDEAKSAGTFSPLALPAQSCGSDSNSPHLHVAVSSCETDFKIRLSSTELINIIGSDAYHSIVSSLGCTAPDAIVLRRTAATNRFIAFHTDHAARMLRTSPAVFL
jgi:hypothetical protein